MSYVPRENTHLWRAFLFDIYFGVVFCGIFSITPGHQTPHPPPRRVGRLGTTNYCDVSNFPRFRVLDNMGKAVDTISGPMINGLWDMTAAEKDDSAVLFVTNVLNGTVEASPNRVDRGNVVRIVLSTEEKHAP